LTSSSLAEPVDSRPSIKEVVLLCGTEWRLG
jgi:hypothetical protein